MSADSPACKASNRSRGTVASAPKGLPRPSTAFLPLAGALIWATSSTGSAQHALRNSLAGEQTVAARKAAAQNQPYTYKLGDFRLLVSASLGAEYNDNVTLVKDSTDDDFLLRPLLTLTASYPITSWNLLRLRLGVGYDYYFDHSELNGLRLESGSELAFDVYVKDVWINLHDRFAYSQYSRNESGIAGSARYGGLDNTAGITATWDLQDVVLTFGYDHQSFFASSSEFDYLDRASELLLGRAGFQVHPRLATGLEAAGSFTSYDQRVLNDNTGYSLGVYADWRPGTYFQVLPRAGYTAYFFDQTSRVTRAVDQDTWYANLTVTHAITEAITYAVTAGHELRLGIQADFIEDTFVRPSVTWLAMKNLSVRGTISYETGSQGSGRANRGVEEDFDWFVGGIGLTHQLTRNLTVSLNYQHTVRTSSAASREYNQNVVGLRVNYTLQ